MKEIPILPMSALVLFSLLLGAMAAVSFYKPFNSTVVVDLGMDYRVVSFDSTNYVVVEWLEGQSDLHRTDTVESAEALKPGQVVRLYGFTPKHLLPFLKECPARIVAFPKPL